MLLGVSLKMYMSAARTRLWIEEVRDRVAGRPDLPEIFVLPTFPLLESVVARVAGTGIAVGAQDVAASDAGAQTGEVSAGVLAELGCRYAMAGHAERRRDFGEDDATVAAKAARAVENGLIPIICIGEPDRCDAGAAADHCRRQLEPVMDAIQGFSAIVAYEPVWAIGADRPAPSAHVRATIDAVRPAAGANPVIYGGSAGPGVFAELRGCVDGLFLGRFAHDPAAFVTVLDQMTAD